MALTLFTASAGFLVANLSHNLAFRSNMSVKYGEDVFAVGSPSEYSESGTPAPMPALPSTVLRFTTDHMPKNPNAGFVFGVDQNACDVLLHVDRSTYISGKQFAIKFRIDNGAVILKNLSRKGTRVQIDRESILLQEQRVIDQSNTVSIVFPYLEIGIFVGSDVVRENGDYRKFLANLHSALPSLGQMRLESSASSALSDNCSSNPYRFRRQLGQGASGVVYEAFHRSSGDLVAIKRFENNGRKGGSWVESSILCSLEHDHIIKFHEFLARPAEHLLVMECAPFGSVLHQSQAHGFDDREGRIIIRQTLEGLSYLHKNGVIHRDLKPANILVTSRRPMHIKLADFGIASRVAGLHNTICGTYLYAAPEIWTSSYNEKIDIWSLGIIVLELWDGRLPTYHRDTWSQEILSHKKRTSKPVREFLDHLLQLDPNQRLSAESCVRLPFVRRRRSSREAERKLQQFGDVPERLAHKDQGQAGRLTNENINASNLGQDSMPDTAIWFPTSTGAVLDLLENCDDRIPTWNPIDPDKWSYGGRAPSLPNDCPAASPVHVVEQLEVPSTILLKKPSSGEPPDKPMLPNEKNYDFYLWGNTWIARDTARNTVNVTHIFNAVGHSRQALHKCGIEWFQQRKEVVRGNRHIQGTYLSYEDAFSICVQFKIDGSFLRGF